MDRKRKKWAYVYMPIFFLVFGYGIIYVIFQPIIHLANSSIELILLNQAPVFDEKPQNIFDSVEKKADEKKNGLEKENNVKTIASSTINYPTPSTEYGQIRIDKIALEVPLIFGDTPSDLRLGAGQYTGSVFPGEVGTTLVGGHNTSDFGRLDLLDIGDVMTIETNYGLYEYELKEKNVTRFDDEEAISSLSESEGHKLILYTCFPVDMVGLTPDRLFLYGDLVSGPIIDPNK